VFRISVWRGRCAVGVEGSGGVVEGARPLLQKTSLSPK